MNRPSTVNDEALDRIPQAKINEALADLSQLAEIEKAISSLSSGKAPGDDGIPAEIFAIGGPALANKLLELVYIESSPVGRRGTTTGDERCLCNTSLQEQRQPASV